MAARPEARIAPPRAAERLDSCPQSVIILFMCRDDDLLAPAWSAASGSFPIRRDRAPSRAHSPGGGRSWTSGTLVLAEGLAHSLLIGRRGSVDHLRVVKLSGPHPQLPRPALGGGGSHSLPTGERPRLLGNRTVAPEQRSTNRKLSDWIAEVTGGMDPLRYRWSGVLSGDGFSVSGYVTESGWLEVAVTDQGNRRGEARVFVTVDSSADAGCWGDETF